MDIGNRSFKSHIKTSLRAKVTLGVVLPLVLILGSFTIIQYARHREAVLDNLSLLASQSGQVLKENLNHQMLDDDLDGVQDLLDTVGEHEAFDLIYVMDTKGEVIFAPYGENVGTNLDNKQPDCQPCHFYPADQRPNSVIVKNDEGERVFRSMHPIENSPECAECHDTEDRLIGVVLTDIPTAPLETPIKANLRENLFWWVGTILVTVIIVNLVISRFVTDRLADLIFAIKRFGEGRSPSLLAKSDPDEIGQITHEFNEMAAKIEARRHENQVLSESLYRQSTQRGELLRSLITAQEDERKRLARELHDELGQVLGGVVLRAEMLDRLIRSDKPQALEQLNEIKDMVIESSDQMHDLILALRPSALDDLGLVSALRTHAERALKNSDIQFELDAHELKRRLPPEVETTLFRITQEAMTNVVRHSKASQVWVELACNNGTFKGTIQDNGQGFDYEKVTMNGNGRRRYGLLGMQERVTLCGGEMEINASPGSGTKIFIRIPLEEIESE